MSAAEAHPEHALRILLQDGAGQVIGMLLILQGVQDIVVIRLNPRHDHIIAGPDAARCGSAGMLLPSRSHAAGYQPVGHDKTVEAPLIPENIRDQIPPAAGVFSVDQVVGSHKCTRLRGGYADFEAFQIDLTQRPLAQYTVGEIAVRLLIVAAEMLDRRAAALVLLNAIRERAGIPVYDMSDVASKYAFRQAVRTERRLEFAFENQRFFDLLRWGTAVSTINEYLASEPFYAAYDYVVNPIAEWQTKLPIPVSVLNINKSVAQNPGY